MKAPSVKKSVIYLLIAGVLAISVAHEQGVQIPGFAPERQARLDTDAQLRRAFEQRQGDLQIKGVGTVSKLLADDNKGSRHQRFSLRLDSGQTLLVAHNIDLAPRIDDLRSVDRGAFFGEYEWSPEGGVIHWTHHDPAGRHLGGWLKHEGRTYQ